MADNGNPQKSEGVKVALIGAAATIIAAVIAGLFALIQSRPAAPPAPVANVNAVPSPQATATAAPATGLMFASKIAPDGEALDAGTSFPANITDLYAVFPADAMPPGLAPFAQRAKAGAHYAYFKTSGTPALSAFGWRWLKDGKQIFEFSADPQQTPFWLQRYDYNGKGVFSEWGPGTYNAVILLNGTPALSGSLTITEK
jgi:hypothetical protein